MIAALRRFCAPLLALGLLAGCSTSPRPEDGAATAPPPRIAPAPVVPTPANTQNAFVLLSGGGTPLSNNYSQYLQARAIATYLKRNYADRPHWIFFGVGNRDGQPPLLADVRRAVPRDGRTCESWLPGSLPDNRPATRESFLAALRDEVLPVVRGGGTLYLFVGDHGSVTRGDQPESEITLWQLERRTGQGGGWATNPKQTLGVSELRRVLAEGIGLGRVVFVMTLCHAGGFHFLGVPRTVTPPAEWFLARPAGQRPPLAPSPLRAAGFTATDEQSPAAGCVTDPDSDSWAGYERFHPEALLGYDLFSLQATGPGAPSFAAAHEAATLVDTTIDKPRASSEQFLERWAAAIEQLAANPQLTPRTRSAVAAYRRAVDTGRVTATTPELHERQEQFQRFIQRLTEQAPAARDLLLAGPRAKLEPPQRPAGPRPPASSPDRPRPTRLPLEEVQQAWRQGVRPAWRAAVLAGDVPGLDGAARTFERQILEAEEKGRDFMTARGGANPLLNELYWRSGYAYPATLDRAKAEAITRWGAERRERILAWARASADPAVRTAADKLAPPTLRRSPAAPAPTARPASAPAASINLRTAAERVLFYRRTLAAWEFLVTQEHHAALAELQALIALERTPLPPAAPRDQRAR